MTKLFFSALFLAATVASAKDINPSSPVGLDVDAVNAASSIQGFHRIKAGGFTYHVISMDSILNGDLNLTTIIIVGQQISVGYGYDDAFVVTPESEEGLRGMVSAKKLDDKIEVTFETFQQGTVKKQYKYNSETRKLQEI